MLSKISLAAALVLGLSTAGHASTATFKQLKSFCADDSCIDGSTPSGTLITDNSHNLYGTTEAGGAHGGGVVYELAYNPDTLAYRYRRLYDFCDLAACADGQSPTNAKLVVDANGIIYGTTESGGGSNNGVVFELVPNESKSHYHYIKIYEFCVEFSGCQDGAKPTGGLTFKGQDQGQTYDGKAALYGSTLQGGRDTNGGTVFSLTPSATAGDPGTLHSLYKFCRFHHTVCTDGAMPGGNLVVDKNGNIWGTTSTGGNTNDAGTIFELVPTQTGPWAESTPYLFCSDANCTDGSAPQTGLAVDSNGNFYGTTSAGGIAYRKCLNDGCGVLFKLTASGTSETTVYSFCTLAKCTDGGSPGGVVLDPNGNIYGGTNVGGAKHNGNFYKVNGTTLTDLYDVKCVNKVCHNGSGLSGALMLDANDDLFGVFMNVGRNGQGGTVFKVIE